MKMADEPKGLLIQEKIEAMIDYAENEVARWPRFYRDSLGIRILDKCYALSDMCDEANSEYYKKPKIKIVDAMNKSLQRMVRRANRSKFITRKREERQLLSLHKYLYWSGLLTEIGRMVGAWLKWAASLPPPPKRGSKSAPPKDQQ